jgi:hypothetical protein
MRKTTEDLARRFVARESEAILDAYRETLDASRRILALATARIEIMEANPAAVDLGDLKNVIEIVRKAHGVESAIGGLNRQDGWRPHSKDGNETACADEAALRSALEMLGD